MWKWYNSRIIKIEKESSTTRRFWVEVEDVDKLDFQAGQFVTMDLPIHEKRLKRWRSYSIANAPDGTNVLEFCIVLLEGGAATEYLFNESEVGTSIRFKGPSGGFVLPDKIDTDLVMICTGTGVAPFRSMIHDLINKNKPFQHIHLIFGTRHQEGILYREEFEKLAKERDDFDYSIALSRDVNWDGHQGYVHPIYLEAYSKQRSDVDFYICGWSNMIDEAVENLILKLGYDKSQVHYELDG